MDFPLLDLMNADACYECLVDTLHPDGLHCPAYRRSDTLSVHNHRHQPVLDYRCRHCGCVFNAYTGTPFQKTHRWPSQLVLIMRGFCQGTRTAQLAREPHAGGSGSGHATMKATASARCMTIHSKDYGRHCGRS